MNFLDALEFRHACKLFDTDKHISGEDKKSILEYGRQSPSSFGLEPWHFLVISDNNLREQIRPACWNQAQITSASFIVIYLSYLPHNFRGETTLLKQRITRKNTDEAKYKMYLNLVTTFLSAQNTQEWAKRQTYIARANMMTGAATLGIDSCPMEGFEVEKLKPLLAEYVDWNNFDAVAIAAFGYRKNAPPAPHTREDLSSIVSYI